MSFLSTLPGRGAADRRGQSYPRGGVFYPRSPGGERRYSAYRKALRDLVFYPRSPGGERRAFRSAAGMAPIFLSTLPGRGAAIDRLARRLVTAVFYPRSPGGERPCCLHLTPPSE